ncbi:arylsulfatase [Lacipirellula parvula]|uniref:Arylsulfatase n=2 Tax=Lacipirellula parvula TaxID=2650471 RepID=A0A5K7X8W5_9BACT|nr:arylsulfatase [Lacipirellula parvula]
MRTMWKRILGATLAFVLLQPTLGFAAPNIVFILVDDLRWDDLGCAGNDFVSTPNIDRIAREGAQFQNAFATTPLCSPSRGSILTGQFARVHGITDNTDRSEQSHRLKTFPQELQHAGYETAYFGKWHMGNDNTQRPGFDRWFCLTGQGTSFDPVVNDDGKEVQRTGYVTDVLNEESVKFLRTKHAKPFMFYLSHKAIHPETYQGPDGKLSDPTLSNFIPAPRHKELYSDAKITRRPSAGVPPTDKPALQQKIDGLPPLGPETGSSDTVILNRLRMLKAVDEGVGEILKALEESGELDNTLIVVAGDHGYFYGEHGLSIERRLAYEESIRIPLIMRYPPLIAAASEPASLVQTIDIAPTFVELGGGEIQPAYQGRSLLPLMKGETPPDWRQAVLVEYFSDTVFPRMKQMGYEAVRGERWKYIHFTDQQGMDELYDLRSDPYELHNLADNPDSAGDLAEMKGELKQLLESTASR